MSSGGIVRSWRGENDGRFTLWVATADGMFQARVNGTGPGAGDRFIDSQVSLHGVAFTSFDMRDRPVRLQVLVPSPAGIAIEEAGAADPFSISIQPIGALRETAGRGRVEHRVRVQGVIVRRPDGTAVVTDNTGSMPVRIGAMTSVLAGHEGRCRGSSNGRVRMSPRFRRLSSIALPSSTGVDRAPFAAPAAIAARDRHDRGGPSPSSRRVGCGLPVHVRGVAPMV
jgi:hypothetical protein